MHSVTMKYMYSVIWNLRCQIRKCIFEDLKIHSFDFSNNTCKEVSADFHVHSTHRTATALNTLVYMKEISYKSECYLWQNIYKMCFGLTFIVKHENSIAACYPSVHLIMNLFFLILCYDKSLFWWKPQPKNSSTLT